MNEPGCARLSPPPAPGPREGAGQGRAPPASWPGSCQNGARPERPLPRLSASQSAEQIAALCRSFNDSQTTGMEGPRGTREPPPRPLARHLSDADRLRKVIQELMDTEKSYVKVTGDSARSCRLCGPAAASGMWAGGPQVACAPKPSTPDGAPCPSKW